MMRNVYGCLVVSFLTALLAIPLSGCGNTSGPSAPQTGDTSIFPNAALLASPEDVYSPQTIVLDARNTGYGIAHIPGAISAPPSLFSTDTEGEVLLPVNELEAILGNMGVTRTSKIIIYDNTTASLGAGGRLFWMLEYLGCTNVSVLNGGWDQWRIQEMPVTAFLTSRQPTVFTALINDSILVEKEYIVSHLNIDPDFVLVDVRTDDEYKGTQLNNTDPRPGHIVGAISIPYTDCYNPDKTVLNYYDLKQLLEENGITKNKEVVSYSTVGKRSGFFYFLTRLMGYTKVKNYAGSIVDWGNADPSIYLMETEP